jgi:hypothetical protein
MTTEPTHVFASQTYREIMDDLMDYMSKDRQVYPEMGNRHQCPTGDPYITLTIGGVKVQGDKHKLWATDIGAAEEFFKRQFDQYAAGKNGVLYWRRHPEVSMQSYQNHFTGGMESYMTITARMVISDQPVLATETKEEAK